MARILKMLVMPDGNTTIIIQGKSRFAVDSIVREDPFLSATVKLLPEKLPEKLNRETRVLVQSLKDAAHKMMQLNPEIPREAIIALDNIESGSFLTHFLSSNVSAEVPDKQKLLEMEESTKKAELLLEYLIKDIQVLEIRQEIHHKVHTDIDQQQRDYYLRQQIKVLQNELGFDGPEKELQELRIKGQGKRWNDEVKKHFFKELDKISRMNPSAAEFPVAMNYVDFLVNMPWGKYTQDNFDLSRAQKILDNDHYGMKKVKERILEHLAVLKLKGDMKSPILCLYGPPGVGKTSLGRSIAKALGRQYVRMSLGGMHDEAEIRGHRKTYIGAMPGKIIGNISKTKSSNPVFILDEIDKLNANFRGDPSSALLEVLDPEQNSSFTDNYMEVGYDLSRVLFIATANSLESIQPALRDRVEIIEISGYTLEEKLEIAKQHLIPKLRTEHGVKAGEVRFSDEAITKIIADYTRESGVRDLSRKLATVIRNTAKSIAMEEKYVKTIRAKEVIKILGAEVFDKEFYQDNKQPGVVTGLAWTQAGGEILFIESSLSRGKGKLTLSGQLGEVMKESAVAALSYLKSNAHKLAIDYRVFDNYDLHVHVPSGAVPKDGPSAGITMLTSVASIFTQRKVKSRLAMTGEITLRGKVLPVGGIKEKILAAKRAGITDIVLCHRNRKDVEEIEPQYIENLNIHYVETVDEVLEAALLESKVDDAISLWPIDDHKKELVPAEDSKSYT